MITEHTQNETSRLMDRLRLIVESTDQGVYALDAQGRCTLFNPAASTITGWPAEEVLGRRLHQFIHHSRPDGAPCPPDACPVLGVLRTGKGVRLVDEVFWRRDGTPFPVQCSSYPVIEDGRVAGLVAMLVDATERKQDKESYRATLNMLEDFEEEKRKLERVQQATMNLLEDFDEERNKLGATQAALINILEDIDVERVRTEQAKALTDSINRELEAFSYSVSHDLRAPLRAISGFAQALMEDCAPRLDEQGRRYLGLIQANAHKMGQLIDDLLTFSRLGRKQMMESPIDMEATARTVFDELVAQAPGRIIEFSVCPVPRARGDRAMIQQVLVNLLSNAIKFTRTRPEAFIEFGYSPEVSTGAYYVKDNGVGFDMQYVDKLFGVFQRLHAVAEFEGTGVGLALAHRIITRHAGRMWAEGRINEGATFYFTLPEGAPK